jgi:hypothetical protein
MLRDINTPEVKLKLSNTYIDTDPNLLIELGRIGNNKSDSKAFKCIYKDLAQFLNFLSWGVSALSQMQNDLHHFLGELQRLDEAPSRKPCEEELKRGAVRGMYIKF